MLDLEKRNRQAVLVHIFCYTFALYFCSELIILWYTTDGTHRGEKYFEQQKEHDVCRRIFTFAMCFHFCSRLILVCTPYNQFYFLFHRLLRISLFNAVLCNILIKNVLSIQSQ